MSDHAHDHDHDAGSCCGHDHGGASDLAEHGQSDAICFDGVGFHYGAVEALHNITLHVTAGTRLGIIGPNGGGKTTLLKLLLGLLDGYAGKIHVNGLTPDAVCKRGDVVGYVPQKHEFEPRFPINVRQVVAMGLCGRTGMMRWHRKADRDRVEQLMGEVGISDLADRPIGSLSGGQQQRAFIARAMASDPPILVLDEPTVGVDVRGQQQFAELIAGLHAEHSLTVMIVSHDLRAVSVSCDKVACLNRTLHYHDSPAGLTPELLQEVFRHDIAPVLTGGA